MTRHHRNTGDEITLFPFLAVLICTMGSLIVLLVIIVQQAKANADRVTQAQSSEQTDDQQLTERLKREVEDLEWRIEVLTTSRAQTIEDLERRREELAYIEDEIRQLHKQLDRAADEAEHIADLAKNEAEDHQLREHDLTELRNQLDYAQEELEQARKKIDNEEPSYALVAYDGSSGTRRRPVYIECLLDRVVLQPEGVVLNGDDFREPLTADNALAAALRSQREYLQEVGGFQHEAPYPLIIVRPDGAHSYAAARAAMQSWDSEFGYELVDQDMKLAYPDADPALAAVVERAVEDARERRQMLKQIAPARFGRRRAVLTASRNGGFVNSEGRGESGPTGGGTSDQDQAGLGGNPYARETNGSAHGSAASSADDFRGTGESSTELFAAERPIERSSGGLDAGDHGPGTSEAGRDGSRGSGTSDATAQRGGTGPDVQGQATLGDPELEPVANGLSNSSPNGDTEVQRGAGATSSVASQGANPKNSTGLRGGPSGGGNASRPTGNGQPGGGSNGSGASQPTPSLAAERGQDWALPNRSTHTTGITRPMYLSCYPDRLVLLPENRFRGQAFEVDIADGIQGQLDALVSEMWKRMERWGIAGNNMYWKPVLLVEVEPDADPRYVELANLLLDSGIAVRRK